MCIKVVNEFSVCETKGVLTLSRAMEKVERPASTLGHEMAQQHVP